MTGRPINESRQLAILMGDKTYTGAAHDRCGTTERYVKGGGCVNCARVIATEQRDARKFLAAHEREQAGVAAAAAEGVMIDDEATRLADRRVIDDTYRDTYRANHLAELDEAHDEMVAEARAADRAMDDAIDDLGQRVSAAYEASIDDLM